MTSRRVRNIKRLQERRARSRPKGPAWLRHPYLLEGLAFLITFLAVIALVLAVRAVQVR